MEKKEGKQAMIKILLYVFLSATGLLLLKIGTQNNFELSISGGVFHLKLNWYLLIGMVLYIGSFITSLIAMKTMDLNIFYPISAGLGYVVICLLSYFVLKEAITKQQLIGMIVILAGVLIMNVKRA